MELIASWTIVAILALLNRLWVGVKRIYFQFSWETYPARLQFVEDNLGWVLDLKRKLLQLPSSTGLLLLASVSGQRKQEEKYLPLGFLATSTLSVYSCSRARIAGCLFFGQWSIVPLQSLQSKALVLKVSTRFVVYRYTEQTRIFLFSRTCSSNSSGNLELKKKMLRCTVLVRNESSKINRILRVSDFGFCSMLW